MDIQYDNALLGILQHEGKIEKFLNVVFGFLMRRYVVTFDKIDAKSRTDFYHIMSADQKKLGFPPGISLKMVVQAFEKYKSIFDAYENKRAAQLPPTTKPEETTSDISASTNLCDPVYNTSLSVAKEVEISTSDSKESKAHPQPANDSKNKEDDGTAPKVYQADPEWYNGARRDKYSWSQTINDMDIKVKVPEHVKTARDVDVQIERKSIKITLKNGTVKEPYLQGVLCWDVLKDESMWTLHPKERTLHISLDKVQERWWEAVFEGEEKIDTRKIDCSRPMHELDDEAQAKIQQLMYDEQRKRQGLPTSEQEKVQDMLAKAWNQEGSPFRGTLCDPTKVMIAPSNTNMST